MHIPHLTLLDLDYGRHGGGSGRIKDACDQLAAIGVGPFEGIDGYTSTADLKNIDAAAIKTWIAHLKSWGVYFNAPLDLDMLLLTAYQDEYTKLADGATGPRKDDDPTLAVLGDSHTKTRYWAKPAKIELVRWYRYLFLSKSKPSTHLRVMAGTSRTDLAQAPATLIEIIDQIKTDLQLT